jgi:hypothetical protein
VSRARPVLRSPRPGPPSVGGRLLLRPAGGPRAGSVHLGQDGCTAGSSSRQSAGFRRPPGTAADQRRRTTKNGGEPSTAALLIRGFRVRSPGAPPRSEGHPRRPMRPLGYLPRAVLRGLPELLLGRLGADLTRDRSDLGRVHRAGDPPHPGVAAGRGPEGAAGPSRSRCGGVPASPRVVHNGQNGRRGAVAELRTAGSRRAVGRRPPARGSAVGRLSQCRTGRRALTSSPP